MLITQGSTIARARTVAPTSNLYAQAASAISVPAITKTSSAIQRSALSTSPAGYISCGNRRRSADPAAETIKATNMPSHTTVRSEEHTSELQSLMRISYAVFCLKKQRTTENNNKQEHIRSNTNIHQ